MLLSAFVDGALNPVEALHVRRHVDACSACRLERNNLEQLKLRVHLEGRRASPTPGDIARWKEVVTHGTRTKAAVLRLPTLAAAVLVWGLMSLSVPLTSQSREPTVDAVAQRPVLSIETLKRFVDVHNGIHAVASLDELRSMGMLETFEMLPGSFIAPNSGVETVSASFADCDPGSVSASALAVLRDARVTLSADIESALETSGVFIEVIDNTEIKLTRGGQSVFVLLRGIEPVSVGI